ncbi:unnamed protein product [Ectocarpus fasciculatus]
MVLVVHGVKLALKGAKDVSALRAAVAQQLSLGVDEIRQVDVVRRSVDARKRRGQGRGGDGIDIKLVYNLHVDLGDPALEAAVHTRLGDGARPLQHHEPYQPVRLPSEHAVFRDPALRRPIVVGSGPAGLFAAHTLALSGYRPVVLEMGPQVERRAKDLMAFWKHNVLTPNSNGVFGEGGAGAFSDGKLTTRTSSPYHRFVHDALIKCGAKTNILFESRAHVGTDELRKIITKFSRDEITASGGTFLYNSQLSNVALSEGAVSHVTFTLRACDLFLGTGHSSRAVYEHLHSAGVSMSRKDFAVGLRLQVSQKYINKLHFGDEARNPELGPAEFTLKHSCAETKRNVYTFCMCPGGVIVNASHGGEEVAVNGMSYSTRGSRYANSAFVVPVGGSDFDSYGDNDALSGLRFQQHWERRCFEAGGGSYAAPAQRVVDYLGYSTDTSKRLPDHKFMGSLTSANLHDVLPDFVNTSLVEGINQFARRMPGLAGPDTLLVGIESRTSAPVRINRDPDTLESVNVRRLYPVGEGAGYAGGIMTACVDGVRAAEAMISRRVKECY